MVSSCDRIFSWTALAFPVLVFLPIPLHGKLCLCECLVPLMAWQCWRKRRDLLKHFCGPAAFLAFALFWMALATAVHFLLGSGSVYDLAVFLYMGFLYAFLCVTPLPSRTTCVLTGILLLVLTLAAYLATKCGDVRGTFLEDFLYFDRHFAQLEPNLLITRFQFLTTNPNLLGGAFILPVLLMMPALQSALGHSGWKLFLASLVFTLLGLLPLLGSASKMSVMTFGLLAGAYAGCPFLKPIHPRFLAVLGVAAFGFLCLMTVLFRTYPAIQEAPWIDFHARGNYSVHQEIYKDILLKGPSRRLLIGYSPQELRRLYPQYADEEHIRETLEPYGFGQDAPLYCTFMDPHNEYLNTTAFFGLPALLAMLAFLAGLLLKAIRQHDTPTALLILGILFCACWEDVASKRYLWCALGITAKRLYKS